MSERYCNSVILYYIDFNSVVFYRILKKLCLAVSVWNYAGTSVVSSNVNLLPKQKYSFLCVRTK